MSLTIAMILTIARAIPEKTPGSIIKNNIRYHHVTCNDNTKLVEVVGKAFPVIVSAIRKANERSRTYVSAAGAATVCSLSSNSAKKRMSKPLTLNPKP